MEILLQVLPATLYALLGLHFWRTRWSDAPQSTLGSGMATRRLSAWERLLLLVAIFLHGGGLYALLFPGGAMHFGFSYAISLMVWLALVFYWIENIYARLEGLQTLAMPMAAICVLLPMAFPGQHLLANAGSAVFRAHFMMAMLAYSLFTLAALHALLMAAAEKRLHKGRLSRALAGLPPLLTMEALLFRLIAIAFVLLTLTLGTGIVFSETLFGKAFRLDHKTVFAITSWVLFGALLVGRHLRGWRGKVALRWTLAGFLTLLLAYVGSRFVLEVLLNRA
ncbi:MAG TPA: cytochrome c biogenesis protein CcsA [Rhodocyclaceae bacterium]|nr:cytochrome c biogenesis protein CcsA [Rhodocyclaceae bacterium]HMV53900.1 cytochrome c biogenesis protein CcsA [Rhodocyclaceae bacterium]HNA02981.1 cytochrome c biogenesis protein CcsA [Rhodocyclaceae bacterium]HNB78075.1 cytochrome c biogenesis protein CcsA [Rhodocyclaceae bacterium]HNC60526.1 cytochrome c biogenesis protein CcsA [Rhodocyclaceae bacterium]